MCFLFYLLSQRARLSAHSLLRNRWNSLPQFYYNQPQLFSLLAGSVPQLFTNYNHVLILGSVFGTFKILVCDQPTSSQLGRCFVFDQRLFKEEFYYSINRIQIRCSTVIVAIKHTYKHSLNTFASGTCNYHIYHVSNSIFFCDLLTIKLHINHPKHVTQDFISK